MWVIKHKTKDLYLGKKSYSSRYLVALEMADVFTTLGSATNCMNSESTKDSLARYSNTKQDMNIVSVNISLDNSHSSQSDNNILIGTLAAVLAYTYDNGYRGGIKTAEFFIKSLKELSTKTNISIVKP